MSNDEQPTVTFLKWKERAARYTNEHRYSQWEIVMSTYLDAIEDYREALRKEIDKKITEGEELLKGLPPGLVSVAVDSVCASYKEFRDLLNNVEPIVEQPPTWVRETPPLVVTGAQKGAGDDYPVVITDAPCSACDGKGMLVDDQTGMWNPCFHCHGTGREAVSPV